MAKISGDTIYNAIKFLNPSIEFTDEEKERLIEHFKKDELNQFYLIIVRKIYEVKTYTVNNEDAIPNIVRIFVDRFGKGSTPVTTDQEIIQLAETVYKVLFALDIKEFYRPGF